MKFPPPTPDTGRPVLSSRTLAALAREAGFDLCGFARPDPIPPNVLRVWLEAGRAADMDWMGARAEERLDVRRLLPDARTVVAFASSYLVEGEAPRAAPVARYARGRDYHATLRDRVRAFRRLLRERHPFLDVQTETYASVDSGPMMEKVWAARAGLGVVGKNGCLITREHGSWVVLAVMALSYAVDRYHGELNPDACGSCDLCIRACPTGAILPGKRVDAGRCLSYQSIENEGPAPEPLRGAYGGEGGAGLAFGCDICQSVCPLNDGAAPAPGRRFEPRPLAALSPRELAALTPEAHRELTQGTAVARAGYDGLRRNAAYALGALGEEAGAGAREVLERLADDPSEVVRDAAQWALARLPPCDPS